MPRLRAVLFDIDDTLYSTTAFARTARKNAVRGMVAAGLRMDEEEVYRELEEVIREFSSNYEHHYDKLIMRLPREAHAGINPALIVASGVVGYHDTKFGGLYPFPDVVPLLESLRKAGMRVGVVTHGWTLKQAEKLVRLKLRDLIDSDAVFISDQVGIAKPNPKLWTQALRSMKLAPEEAMHVGDSLAHDIAPPQSLGLPTVWARRAAKPGQEVGEITPDHVVDDFKELAGVLRESYGIALEPS
jgi:putative hydrolase of the HAD superfamily